MIYNIKNGRKAVAITSDEYSNFFGGVLTEADFSTSRPNSCRIDKIALGIAKYLAYKATNKQEKGI